ncbi:hypothetical protein [Daejeonella sp.]|uniref:hypothetical protein n=1 Tax=Daejeonella sp. TaxID=2805397 RepID=UPI0030BAC560
MKTNIVYQPKIKKPKTIHWTIAGVIAIFALGIMTIRPVPILPEEDLMVLKGKVVGIHEGGVKDVTIKLEGRNEIFYVNRGLERGLNLQELQAQLINQDVLIKYPDHWTLLNFNKNSVHISKIEHHGETVFSEVN